MVMNKKRITSFFCLRNHGKRERTTREKNYKQNKTLPEQGSAPLIYCVWVSETVRRLKCSSQVTRAVQKKKKKNPINIRSVSNADKI